MLNRTTTPAIPNREVEAFNKMQICARAQVRASAAPRTDYIDDLIATLRRSLKPANKTILDALHLDDQKRIAMDALDAELIIMHFKKSNIIKVSK